MTANERGFSLVEALVATTVLLVSALSLAQLSATSTQSNASARSMSLATILAVDKLEQLRSVDWGDAALAPSSAGTLSTNSPGYAEFLDDRGDTLSGPAFAAAPPPAGATYARRWSVEALPTTPDTVVLQVVVARWPDRGAAHAVRVTAVRTRTVD